MHLLLIVVYCFNKRRALPGRVYLNQSFMVEVNLLNVLSPGFVTSEADLSQQVPNSSQKIGKNFVNTAGVQFINEAELAESFYILWQGSQTLKKKNHECGVQFVNEPELVECLCTLAGNKISFSSHQKNSNV